MRVTIDTAVSPRREGNAMVFDARDAEGGAVAVAIDGSSWETLNAEFGRDALAEIEQLALTGSWQPHGSGRVWRVFLI